MSWYDPRSWFAPKQSAGPNRGLLAKVRDTEGGWPGPDAAHNTPAEVDVTTDRVRGGPRGVNLPVFLPWYDEKTHETPLIRAAYRPMLADSHVKTAFLGKILAVASLDLKVLPADKKNARDREIAEFVKWNLTERLADGIPGLVWSVLSGGLIDGMSVCHKKLEHQTRGKYAGKYVLSELRPKDVGLDVVVQVDEYLKIVGLQGLRFNGGEQFSPADFLIYRHMPLYGSPVGTSDFRAAYRPYWIKDTAWKLRSVAMERRASPLLFATYKTPSTKASLDAWLSTANSRGWGSAPEDAKLQAIDIAGGGDATFDSAIKGLAHEIFLAIQGAILQALEGSTTDGRGNSQVHRQTADQLVWHLAAALQSLLNNHDGGLVRDLVDLNYVVQEYPKASLTAVDVNELTQEWQIDQGLLQAGLKLSKEELYERYGRQRPEEDDDVLEGAKPPPPGGGLPFADDEVNVLTARPRRMDDEAEQFCQTGSNAGKPGPCPEGQQGGAPVPEQHALDAFAAAASEIKRANARTGGVITVPELIDGMRKRHPSLTPDAIKALLQKWQKDDKLTLQLSNDPRLEPRSKEGIMSPRGLLYYVSVRPATHADPARGVPAPTPFRVGSEWAEYVR